MQDPAPRRATSTPRPILIALVVLAAIALVSSALATLYFLDLAGISPCDGGFDFGPGGPSCAVPPLQLQQIGATVLENGIYSAVILLTPGANIELNSNSLVIAAWNDSGTNFPLSGVSLHSAGGQLLARYAASGQNWTTSQSIEILWSDLLNLTSTGNLAGQYVTVADIGDTQFGPFACPLT